MSLIAVVRFFCFVRRERSMFCSCSLSSSLSFSLVRFVLLRISRQQKERVSPSLLPASLIRAPIDGPGCLPTDTEDHTQCSPCSHAPFSRAATACLSSPRDWEVSMGSHMQQDMDIFFGATTSRRTSPTCSDRSPLKPGVKQLAIIPRETLLSLVCVNACFTARRAELHLICNSFGWSEVGKMLSTNGDIVFRVPCPCRG